MLPSSASPSDADCHPVVPDRRAGIAFRDGHFLLTGQAAARNPCGVTSARLPAAGRALTGVLAEHDPAAPEGDPQLSAGWHDRLESLRTSSARNVGALWRGCHRPSCHTNGGCGCGWYPRKASRSSPLRIPAPPAAR
jgi:hypothetical protein